MGHISADTLWKLLSADLKDHLEGKINDLFSYILRKDMSLEKEIDFVPRKFHYFLIVDEKLIEISREIRIDSKCVDIFFVFVAVKRKILFL